MDARFLGKVFLAAIAITVMSVGMYFGAQYDVLGRVSSLLTPESMDFQKGDIILRGKGDSRDSLVGLIDSHLTAQREVASDLESSLLDGPSKSSGIDKDGVSVRLLKKSKQ